MAVEKLPNLDLPDFGDVCDPSRPVLSFRWQAAGPHRASAHSHARAHIIYPESGTYWVSTPEGNWLVPSGLAVWIPPRVFHEVYSHGSVSAQVLFVDPAYADPLPPRCGTVKVSSLLASLLLRTVTYGNDYPPQGPAARLALVMLDELAVMEFAPLLIPTSKDARLTRVMKRLIDEHKRGLGSSPQSLERLAKEAAASPRTLARLFRTETGMTFTQWRTSLALVDAIERLEQGATVTEIAIDLGYSSASSFTYMFRKNLGISPGRYRARPLSQAG